MYKITHGIAPKKLIDVFTVYLQRNYSQAEHEYVNIHPPPPQTKAVMSNIIFLIAYSSQMQTMKTVKLKPTLQKTILLMKHEVLVS